MSDKPISADAVHRAAEITSKGGGGNSEQEHRAMAAEARRMDRERSERGPTPEKQRTEPRRQRVEVREVIRHD